MRIAAGRIRIFRRKLKNVIQNLESQKAGRQYVVVKVRE